MKISFNISHTGNWGGDKYEKLGWPIFGKAKFPNYETFWASFVVPLTNRPDNIHFKKSSDIKERELAGIHYSIYYYFYKIYEALKNEIDEDAFDLSLIRLSNICDLTEEFLYKLFSYKEIFDSKFVNDMSRETRDQTGELDVYEKLFERSSVSGVVINRLDVLSKKINLDSYRKSSEDIRRYRNIIAHSWLSFQLNGMVPKLENVKKYKDWLLITDIIKSDNEKKKEELLTQYTKTNEQVSELTESLIANLNSIWAEIIKLLNLKPFTLDVGDEIRDEYFSIPLSAGSASGQGDFGLSAQGPTFDKDRE